MKARTSNLAALCLISVLITCLLMRNCSAQSAYSKNLDIIRNAVVYLHVYDDKNQLKEVGTGFLLLVPSKSNPRMGYELLVTARHMVDPVWMGCENTTQSVSIVFNTKDYDPAKDTTGVLERRLVAGPGGTIWTYPEDNSADAAVTVLDGQSMSALALSNEPLRVSELATEDELLHVNSGDPVVSAGLLDGASGIKRNQPIFKFGNVSSIPQEKIGVSCCPSCTSKPLIEWMIAASLVPGNSGSLIYYMPNGLLDAGTYNKRPFLMGVQSSSFIGSDVAGMTPARFIMQAVLKLKLQDADLPGIPNVAVPTANPSEPNSPKPLPLPH